MRRSRLRLRIDGLGRLEVVDPGMDSLDLIRAVDPSFQVRSAPLPCFSRPRFLKTRISGCGLRDDELPRAELELLWRAHRSASESIRGGRTSTAGLSGEATLLDLKVEIARRLLHRCGLCGHECGVDRLAGEMGRCRLGRDAHIAEYFVHIAEESPINPSVLLSLGGCGLQCRFCQQADLLNSRTEDHVRLAPGFWKQLPVEGARSLSFAGGNPDESIYAVLEFLRSAPESWRLPIVWNCNGFAAPGVVELLDGIADVYLPDLKFSSPGCASLLADASGYPETARRNIAEMSDKGVPVIVRILVLPGHVECCHLPALEFLKSIASERLWVSIRGQYYPDGEYSMEEGLLGRRPTREEIATVVRRALLLGLNILE